MYISSLVTRHDFISVKVDAIVAEAEIREAFKIFDIDGKRLFLLINVLKRSRLLEEMPMFIRQRLWPYWLTKSAKYNLYTMLFGVGGFSGIRTAAFVSLHSM